MRGSTIHAIETALEKYHADDWKRDFPEKYKHLAEIMQNIIKQREGETNSRRRQAVVPLGKQVIDVLQQDNVISK